MNMSNSKYQFELMHRMRSRHFQQTCNMLIVSNLDQKTHTL